MKPWKFRPAEDHQLHPKERTFSIKREAGLIDTLLGLLWWSFVRFYLRTVHRLTISGSEQLPQEPGFIVVSNHASHLDTLIIAAAMPRRWNGHIYPIAAGDTFFNRPQTAWLATRFLNALPLWRKRSASHALRDLRSRAQQQRDIMILFPEGTRSRSGAMSSFKAGIGRIIAETSVPIIPVYIHGAFDAYPPDKKIPRPRAIKLTIGPSLKFENRSNDKAGWSSIATDLQDAVQNLSA